MSITHDAITKLNDERLLNAALETAQTMDGFPEIEPFSGVPAMAEAVMEKVLEALDKVDGRRDQAIESALYRAIVISGAAASIPNAQHLVKENTPALNFLREQIGKDFDAKLPIAQEMEQALAAKARTGGSLLATRGDAISATHSNAVGM